MTDAAPTVQPTENDPQEMARLTRLFGRSLALILFIPTIAIAALLFVMWDLSQDVSEVRVLEEISRIEQLSRRNKNYELAITGYRDLARSSKHPQAYARWASTAAGASDFAQARLAQKEAGDAGRVSPELHSALSYVELTDGNQALAIEFGEKALAKNPLDVSTLNNLAWIYGTSADDAIQDIERALEYSKRAVSYTLGRNLDYLDTFEIVHLKSMNRDQLMNFARASFDDVVRGRVLAYVQKNS